MPDIVPPSAGETLPYVIARGSGQRGICFLHGVGLSATTFEPLVDTFGAHGRAVAVPLPGYDGSPTVDPYSILAVSTRIGHILDGLGIETADLVGHSLGGMVALEMATRMPSRVASLTLVATTPYFGSKDGSFEKAFLADRFGALDAGKTLPDLASAMIKEALGDSPDGAGVQAAIAAQSAVPVTAYRASVQSLVGFDRRADLARIPVPCLCVAGELDKLAPPRSMERMAQAIPGAHFIAIAGAGHLVYLEKPNEFAHELAAFLEEARRIRPSIPREPNAA